jgi:hypothetical protein
MALVRNQKGQISIFFSASLVVLVSIIAFVINIGLFVKAKINLQNATDAAAFSGAAVQARQISKIAHLNWEMRNIYKEWLYKYYVIGNLNINDVKNVAPNDSGLMSFKMETDLNAISQEVTPDPYNFPSVCIHLAGSKTNLCKRYSVPGLPEFGSSNLPGAEEASRAFQDALISSKVNDCVERTKLNMYVAASWAYNILSNDGLSFANLGPAILADRQGAWPKAVELAIRIRNLEKAVNRTARDESVCVTPGASSKVNCQLSINSVSSEKYLGNERIVKAFYSGFRNIGGSFDGDEMKNSFTLTELKPNPALNPNTSNASNLLIPTPYDKQYLDLKLMMVNYAIFYTALIPRSDSATSGACDVSKSAIPIPGYPLGFYKNPDVLTYYAVKGEAEFVGMFNPFGDSVKLTAYAAAKPMGGRIGPMLFTQAEDSEAIVGRTDDKKRRSVPYIFTIDIIGTMQRLVGRAGYEKRPIEEGEYAPGAPLPINGSTDETRFWLTDQLSPVGGKITTTRGVQFGVPNLAYDFEDGYSSTGYSDPEEYLYTLKSASDSSKQIGLFSKKQFGAFKGNLGSTVGPEDLDVEIARVRAPTRYEAANYLIPIPFEEYKETDLGHFGQLAGSFETLKNGIKRYRNYIYAPLYGDNQEDILYKTPNEVVSGIAQFMREQESGIVKYTNAMNMVAKSIAKQGDLASASAAGAKAGYISAAKGISDINFDQPVEGQIPSSCSSLTGTFLHFFWGGPIGMPNGTLPGPGSDGALCPMPLGELLQKYYSPTGGPDPSFRASHYSMEYSWNPSAAWRNRNDIFSAYVPGPFTGVSMDGTFSNLSASGRPEAMHRNFYSTKLVALKSLKSNGGYNEKGSNFNIFSEGDVNFTDSELKQSDFKNFLNLPSEAENIKH